MLLLLEEFFVSCVVYVDALPPNLRNLALLLHSCSVHLSLWSYALLLLLYLLLAKMLFKQLRKKFVKPNLINMIVCRNMEKIYMETLLMIDFAQTIAHVKWMRQLRKTGHLMVMIICLITIESTTRPHQMIRSSLMQELRQKDLLSRSWCLLKKIKHFHLGFHLSI